MQKSSGTGSVGIAGPWADLGPALPKGSSVIDRGVANVWVIDSGLLHSVLRWTER